MGAVDNDLLKTLRGEAAGKVPFWEVWFAKRELAEKLVGGPLDAVPKRIELARRMGWEYLTIGGIGFGLPSGSETASDGTTHYVGGAFNDLAQLEDVPPLEVDRLAAEFEPVVGAAHEEGMAAILYLPWCFHSVATAMGLENFAYMTADDMGFLHTAFEFVEERNRLAVRELAIPLGVDAVLFDGDCAYKTGLMVSPPVFRELVFERTKKTVAPLREADIPYTFHTDGKLDDVIPLLIELGFSAVHGVEAMANDLGDIKRRFGKRITLIGNMDVDFLTRASPDEVRSATRRMMDIGSPGGRYIAACNTSPCDYIPDENYLAMVETINDYGGAK